MLLEYKDFKTKIIFDSVYINSSINKPNILINYLSNSIQNNDKYPKNL